MSNSYNPADHAAQALAGVVIPPADNSPVGFAEAVTSAKDGINRSLAAASKLETERAAIQAHKQRGTMPEQGISTLQAEATSEAERVRNEASRQVEASLKIAEALIVDRLTPKLESDTAHVLARQSLDLIVGDATGPVAANRLLGHARSAQADPKVLALTRDPYLHSYLLAKQVPDAASLVADIQRTAAQHAAERPGAGASARISAEALASLQGVRDARDFVQSGWRIANM